MSHRIMGGGASIVTSPTPKRRVTQQDVASTRIWSLYLEGSRTVIALHRSPTGYVLRRLTSCGEVVSHTVSGHYDAMLLAAEWIARAERERALVAHPWQDTALEAGALTTEQEVS